MRVESENTNVCERDKKLTHDGLHVRNRHCLVCSKRRPEEKQIEEIIKRERGLLEISGRCGGETLMGWALGPILK